MKTSFHFMNQACSGMAPQVCLPASMASKRVCFGRSQLTAFLIALFVAAMLAGFPTNLNAQENNMDTSTPPTRSMEKLVHITATVEAIDPAKREVTLKGPMGNLVTLEVSDEVKRLDEIKVGDQVAATYYIGIVAELRPPTEAEKENPLVVLSDGERATMGAPAGSGARVIRVVATVEALDRITETATLKGPAGRYMTVHVADPKVLEKPHIGDTVVVTCTQALAISVKPVNGKSDE
jgi:hypothetical protein